MKDNEIAGVGNSLDFGARGYNPRLGIWNSPDKKPKPNLSSYQFGRGNPIIFIDPDGNTEYYFQGKWVASDGANNNMIGLVSSKSVKKAMEKGTYSFPVVKNGFKNTDVFTIDANVLKVAREVLGLALSDKGKDREFSTGMNKGEDGYKMTKGGILEGKPKANAKIAAETPSHDPCDVDIHSHTTMSGLVDGKPFSSGADIPSGGDKANMDKSEMFIIVGKHGQLGATTEKAINGSEYTQMDPDNRGSEINIYDKDHKDSPAATVSQKETDAILTDHATRK